MMKMENLQMDGITTEKKYTFFKMERNLQVLQRIKENLNIL